MSDMVCEIDAVEIAVNPRMGLFNFSMQSIQHLMQFSISMEKNWIQNFAHAFTYAQYDVEKHL